MKNSSIIWFAWLVALVATMGSLYASEIAGWTPCILCWYQRILMYPLVITLWVGASNKDVNVAKYVGPITVIGGAIALYHNLLRWGVLSASCPATGPSCAQGEAWFGFITLPFLSLTAFILIGIAMAVVHSRRNEG